MMTAEQYIQSIRDLGKRNVYVMGEKVDNIVDHPMIRPSINCCAMTYKLAEMPEYQDLMVTKSHITGKPINRFANIHQSAQDLTTRIKTQRLCGVMTGSCYQRCAGLDAMNATWCCTYDFDQKLGTQYHARFKKFVEMVQEKDLVVAAAMTDPKGNRSLPPSKQADPDMFLRVVKEDDKGVYIRGAKMHLTGGLNSHYILVFPTQNMGPEEKAYVIAGAIKADDPTVTFVYGRQSSDTRKMEGGNQIDVGNLKYGGQEAVTWFENTFIPWEHVFMYGETDMVGLLVERFAGYHRQSYAGCKTGNGDALIGAAACIAEYNGASKANHIKDKIIEMIHLNETLYSCGISAGAEGRPTASGNYLVDVTLANICKHNVTRFPYEIARLAQDLAGGIMVTMPSEKDFELPGKVGEICRKVVSGDAKFPPEYRQRMLRFIEAMTLGSIAVGYLTESMHGAGSPQAQRIMIQRGANLETKKSAAKRLCGIDPDGLF